MSTDREPDKRNDPTENVAPRRHGLEFSQSDELVDVWINDDDDDRASSSSLEDALGRTTHLGIGAHPDDLEFMALAGILECFDDDDEKRFSGVTVTDGGGSVRTGPDNDDDDAASALHLKRVRRREQRTAACIGRYACMVQLGHVSDHVRDVTTRRRLVVEDVRRVLLHAATTGRRRLDAVYTHNPMDRHATHVGTCVAVVEAIRQMESRHRPRRLIGCEVWRGLDWLDGTRDATKIAQDVSARGHVAGALNGVYDSQIGGGKRYDTAVEGRRRANATFHDSHEADHATHVQYGVDMTELIQDDNANMTVKEFCQERIRYLEQSVLGQLDALGVEE